VLKIWLMLIFLLYTMYCVDAYFVTMYFIMYMYFLLL